MPHAASRQMKLGYFLFPTGHHVAAWRHPDADPRSAISLYAFIGQIRAAQAAKFDLGFLADNDAFAGGGGRSIEDDMDALSRTAIRYTAQFEPVTLLSALASVSDHIGLVATVSTTYNDPYNVARKFSSLDCLSGGRAGWNVVTSSNFNAARNFSMSAHPNHAARYERAGEFVDVVLGLWDSWDDDAFLYDKASGRYFDPAKVRFLDHEGEHFSVRGPLNVPRSPQGRPVVVQAGTSEPAKEQAARTAEIVFTVQQTVEESRSFSRDLRSRLERYGRRQEALKIMPGVCCVVAGSRAEAEDEYAAFEALIQPQVGLMMLNSTVGLDLSGYPLDMRLSELPATDGHKGRQQLMLDMGRREGLTVAELARRAAGTRGHWMVMGTARDVADALEERFVEGEVDGFNVMAPLLPQGMDAFIAGVLPELRRRGLFREEYEGRTLRENLGLPWPESARSLSSTLHISLSMWHDKPLMYLGSRLRSRLSGRLATGMESAKTSRGEETAQDPRTKPLICFGSQAATCCTGSRMGRAKSS
jgi:N-acetyl-S-(2-succino)cysteine monooxygenase